MFSELYFSIMLSRVILLLQVIPGQHRWLASQAKDISFTNFSSQYLLEAPILRHGFVRNRSKSLLLQSQEVLCNTSWGCSDALSLMKGISSPIKERLHNLVITNVVHQLQNSTLRLHDTAAQLITPERLDRIEQQPMVSRMEKFFTTIASTLGLDGSRDSTPTLISGASQLPMKLYNTLRHVDHLPEISFTNQTLVRKICHTLKLNVPTCQPTTLTLSNTFPFPQLVVVTGFRTFNSNGQALEDCFDGSYTLQDISNKGSPIYVKRLNSTERKIMLSSFHEPITSLVLWATWNLNSPLLRLIHPQGILAAITPNLPVMDFIFFGRPIPFALSLANPTSSCRPGSYKSKNTTLVSSNIQETFPLCIQRHDHTWRFWSRQDAPCILKEMTKNDEKNICIYSTKKISFQFPTLF